MPVMLENRLRQMQVFNLPHDAYCRGGACECSQIVAVTTEQNARTGERTLRRTPKKVPPSLTLLARETRAGLRTTVLTVPDVRAAIARGALRVVAQHPDQPSPPAPAPAPPRVAAGRKE